MLPTTLGPFLSLLYCWLDYQASGRLLHRNLMHRAAMQLYRSLRSDTSQTNTLISPLLLANSLLALGSGAKGSTVDQFHNLLGNTKDKNAFSEALKSVRECNGNSFMLHSSSALFSKAPKPEKRFLDDLQSQFGLQHVALDVGEKQDDMEKLHSWAKEGMGGEETTAGTLKQELKMKAGAMILANALHFLDHKDKR